MRCYLIIFIPLTLSSSLNFVFSGGLSNIHYSCLDTMNFYPLYLINT